MFKENELRKVEDVGANRFTFNGNIIKELGEESISNPYIAVSELIKNAYDADSEIINVEFNNIGKQNAEILIFDNGKGMDSNDIKNKWMDVGSPHKNEITRTTEHNRIPVGAKGIGRFASQCLGKKTTLITGAKDERTGYKLIFEWDNYKSINKATDIDNKTQKFPKKASDKGTTIIINNLKHRWNDIDKMKNLAKDIFLLNSPIEQPKKLRIKENISSCCPTLRRINNEFLNKCAYHLIVKLSKNKEIEYEFYKDGRIEKKEKKELKESLTCGNTSFDLYFYYRDKKPWKIWLKKDMAKSELDEIKNVLDDFGGIKLYRDHFRVKPYGEKDADWIGLDGWSRNTSIVPGNAQVFGVVNISKETNPNIMDTTTREGVINTPEYFDLVKFVTTCISIFVDMRKEVESERAKTKKKVNKSKKIEVKPPRVQETPVAPQEIPFIDVKGDFPKNYYKQLLHEANECERNNYPNAAFWMCRKIVENLVYHILEKKFPNEIDLYYEKNKGRNVFLSSMIQNLYDKRNDFKPNVKGYIEQFKTEVGKFKKDVDCAIHNSPTYLTEKSELKQYKINKIIQLLLDIYNNQFASPLHTQ